MSIDTYIRDGMASALVEVYRQRGKTLTYKQRDGSNITVYGDSKAESVEPLMYMGTQAEKHTRRFFIPRQTSFPPTNGVQIGDAITENSVVFRAVQMSEDSDGLQAEHEVLGEAIVAKKAGV